MRKSRKLFLTLAAVAAACAAVAGLAACDEEPAPPPTDGHTHAYGAWTVTAKPTADTEGLLTKTCPNCDASAEGHTKTRALPALTGGGYLAGPDSATCTAGGSITYSCTVDGEAISFTVDTPAKQHAYGAWAVTAKPTADAEGLLTKTCPNCDASAEGHAKTHALPVLTDSGYQKTEDSATCTAGGSITYSCTVDGEAISFDVNTSKKGHQMGPLVEGREATCESEGAHAYYECGVCHHKYADLNGEDEIEDIVIPAAHVYEAHPLEEATCQKAGKQMHYTCAKCNKFFDEHKTECDESDLVIPQIEHTQEFLKNHYTPAQINVNYCTEIFEAEHWYCTMCEKYFNADMEPYENESAWQQHAPLGHDFDGAELVPAVDATCTTSGMPAHYECNRCHEYYATNEAAATNNTPVQEIPAMGHHWVSEGELGDPVPGGGKISIKCDNANCNEKQEIDYKDAPALTGTTVANAVQIDGAGQYYIKGTAATNLLFSIPITKAGTYHVDFINLDASSRNITFAQVSNGIVHVFDEAGTSRMTARFTNPRTDNKFPVMSNTYGSLTGELLSSSGPYRWFEFQAEESLVGGKIVFGIKLNSASADSPFPAVIDVKITDPAPEESSARIAAHLEAMLPTERQLALY